MFDKWYDNYIDNIDLNGIEYLNINDDELKVFYKENGYIPKDGNFILSDDGSYGWVSPRGMHYLQFNYMPGMKYVIGTCKNNINKNTIISALAYIDDYKLFNEQEKFITYFSTLETNIYFRGMGLFKNLVKNSYSFINPNQHILISGESIMGKRCHVYRNIRNIYKNNGFKMDIRSDTDDFVEDEYYDFLKKNGYIKVRKR